MEVSGLGGGDDGAGMGRKVGVCFWKMGSRWVASRLTEYGEKGVVVPADGFTGWAVVS